MFAMVWKRILRVELDIVHQQGEEVVYFGLEKDACAIFIY